jgi:hypothetical protein
MSPGFSRGRAFSTLITRNLEFFRSLIGRSIRRNLVVGRVHIVRIVILFHQCFWVSF